MNVNVTVQHIVVTNTTLSQLGNAVWPQAGTVIASNKVTIQPTPTIFGNQLIQMKPQAMISSLIRLPIVPVRDAWTRKQSDHQDQT